VLLEPVYPARMRTDATVYSRYEARAFYDGQTTTPRRCVQAFFRQFRANPSNPRSIDFSGEATTSLSTFRSRPSIGNRGRRDGNWEDWTYRTSSHSEHGHTLRTVDGPQALVEIPRHIAPAQKVKECDSDPIRDAGRATEHVDIDDRPNWNSRRRRQQLRIE